MGVHTNAGGNVQLWLTYVNAVTNCNFTAICSPHPCCVFFLLPLSTRFLFLTNCASLLPFTLTANILAPVLLLPCWLPPPQFQLPSAPLDHKSSLIQLLLTFPMLQLSHFFSEIAFSVCASPVVPRVDHLLSSKPILHGSDYDQHVLNPAFLPCTHLAQFQLPLLCLSHFQLLPRQRHRMSSLLLRAGHWEQWHPFPEATFHRHPQPLPPDLVLCTPSNMIWGRGRCRSVIRVIQLPCLVARWEWRSAGKFTHHGFLGVLVSVM